jgi:hypothetical protein
VERFAEVGLPDGMFSKVFVPLESPLSLSEAGPQKDVFAAGEGRISLNVVLYCARSFMDDDGRKLCCVVVGSLEESEEVYQSKNPHN